MNKKKIYSYVEFKDYILKNLNSATHSIEQVIQFNSKYYVSDPNLFKYDVNKLAKNINSEKITKKLYIILRSRDEVDKIEYKKFISPYVDNGFNIKQIFLCNISKCDNINLDDLILFDNHICVTAETIILDESVNTNREKTLYHIYSLANNEEKIKKVRKLLKRLRNEAFKQQNQSKLFEPIFESADINLKFSLNLCQNGIMSDGDCRWYHSVWQYLRVIDKVSSPEWHSTFYEKCFDKIISNVEIPNILISGTADYSLLAYVFNSLNKADKVGNIYVLDTCQTPLEICNWYSQKKKFKINTLNMNIFDLHFVEQKFDLICSDAFLTRFSKSDAAKVLEEWYNALNVGGIVVTTVRCRNCVEKEDKHQKNNYIEECINRFQKWEISQI